MPPETAALVQVSDVSKRYGRQQVLRDVSMALSRGEILGLLGPSGAGKTTLINVIAGILRPDSGDVWAFGEPMPRLDLMGRMGFMAQSTALYLDLTAEENLRFFGSIYGLRGSGLTAAIVDVLAHVDLGGEHGKPAGRYSGGMQRRLSLAIALVHRPEVLLLDEPTVGLDPLLRESIWRGLRARRDEGTGILVTTHVMDEAAKCDRLVMIRAGQVIAEGRPADLLAEARTDTLEQAFLHFARSEAGADA